MTAGPVPATTVRAIFTAVVLLLAGPGAVILVLAMAATW